MFFGGDLNRMDSIMAAKISRTTHDSKPFSSCLSNPRRLKNSKADYPLPLTPANEAKWLLGAQMTEKRGFAFGRYDMHITLDWRDLTPGPEPPS